MASMYIDASTTRTSVQRGVTRLCLFARPKVHPSSSLVLHFSLPSRTTHQSNPKHSPRLTLGFLEIIRVNALQRGMFGEDLKDEYSGRFMPRIFRQQQTREPKTIGEVIQRKQNRQESLQREPVTGREIDGLDVAMASEGKLQDEARFGQFAHLVPKHRVGLIQDGSFEIQLHRADNVVVRSVDTVDNRRGGGGGGRGGGSGGALWREIVMKSYNS